MISRKGKTVSLDINNNWKISYGTFDVKHPITLYIKLQTYVIPLEDKIDTNTILNSIGGYQIPYSSIFCSRFIHKTTFATAKVKKNKPSCLVITLTVKQEYKGMTPFDSIQKHVVNLVIDFMAKITTQWNFKYNLSVGRHQVEISPTDIELGREYKKLLHLGWEPEEVAQKNHKTVEFIMNCITKSNQTLLG